MAAVCAEQGAGRRQLKLDVRAASPFPFQEHTTAWAYAPLAPAATVRSPPPPTLGESCSRFRQEKRARAASPQACVSASRCRRLQTTRPRTFPTPRCVHRSITKNHGGARGRLDGVSSIDRRNAAPRRAHAQLGKFGKYNFRIVIQRLHSTHYIACCVWSPQAVVPSTQRRTISTNVF